jgi:hypothetical protein
MEIAVVICGEDGDITETAKSVSKGLELSASIPI